VLQREKLTDYRRNVREKKKNQKRVEMKRDVEPVSLQFLDGYSEQDKTEVPKLNEKPVDRVYSLPYSIVSKIEATNHNEEQLEDNENDEIYYDRTLRCDRGFFVVFF